ncbi:MAG TPA: hypothetical protein VNV38_12550 [Stellaceae bacterium]|jgi:hypothetical protein|nr:hypothetical protein [Stellaceae bacterium]
MMLAGARRGDWVHLALMVAALGIAYVMPFELLVLAYVVLGPAHYTTEISWLHDRRYFLKRRYIALALAAIAVAATLIDNSSWFGFVIWAALVVSAAAAATRSLSQTAVLLAVAIGLTALMAARWPALSLMGALLTSVVHVSLFTLIFMALGAWRTQSRAQAALIGAYIAAIVLIMVIPPSGATVIPGFQAVAQEHFGNLVQTIGMLFGLDKLRLDGRLTGFLAFIYTYHYLNWFIKAGVIRWADIPPRRWIVIGVVSAASTGLYFYDYALGFSALLVLSLGHVVLEFPLNALTMRQLGEAAAGSLFGGPPQRRLAARRR